MKDLFVVNTFTAWDEQIRARHQIALQLAEAYNVIFITKNKWGLPGIQSRDYSSNLEIVTPYWPLDDRVRRRIPGLNELYQKWLVKKMISEKYLSPKIKALINFDYTAHIVLNKVNKLNIITVYYCNDEYIGNSRFKSKLIENYQAKCENEVIKASDICIGTSAYLFNKLKSINHNSYEIKLGAPNITDPPNYKLSSSKSKIRVGLVGTVNQRVPLNILNEITNNPKFELSIAGSIDQNYLNKIIGHNKIKKHGILKGDKLFEFVKSIDVGIAPYNEDFINPGVTPNKLWLYLAFGKPVVVTDLNNIHNWEFEDGIIYRAQGNNNFTSLIQDANANDNEVLYNKRIKIAQTNTWSQRINSLLDIISQYGNN